MAKIKTLTLLSAMATTLTINADIVAHFPMDVSSGCITETVSGKTFEVEGHFAPENVDGAVGKALRFDGYTSHIKAQLGDFLPSNTKKLTLSMWVAMPCYPIIKIDTDTDIQTPILTCLDEEKKTGFGFYIGFDGKYSFRTFMGGWPVDIKVDTPLPTYKWNNLTAVIDCDARAIKLYNNGEEVGSGKASGSVTNDDFTFYMGQGTESNMSGPFELMSFNGLIDDVTIWNDAVELSTIQGWSPENTANLDIPESRFEDEILRPRFHGMPAAGWTNECHGMFYSDSKYHLFFQKNGDGPFMARLHWGHISSENLYNWKEEKIALAPGEWYDIKGCWSGCVFADDVVTGGKPNIIYTAVDYVKAMIAQASPDSETLVDWTKSSSNPIIQGKPNGLSDDFRDPYFFRNGDDAYIIVGSSKNGIGTTTLHRYNPSTKRWSNDGDLFFTGTSTAQDGSFWEMPNITKMPDGKWLFTATPLATSQGVHTLYWVGDIDSNGHFVPDASSATPRLVEMNSKEGFGMLSPTIYQHDGKTIVLGIVPDKLSASSNWNLGWAHCYSLPREWSLSENGTLVQKPFEGLSGMRSSAMYSRTDFTLSGVESLTPVEGRSAEIYGIFEVGTTPFGFNIFKSGSASGTITYNPASGELIADFSSLSRLVNDGGVYDGIYRCPLPVRPAQGDSMKINVFIDHSIIDIFVNDRYATSIRVFPTDPEANGIEVFADGTVNVKDLKSWILDVNADSSGIYNIYDNNFGVNDEDSVYTISGAKISNSSGSTQSRLPSGIYISNGEKFIVK